MEDDTLPNFSERPSSSDSYVPPPGPGHASQTTVESMLQTISNQLVSLSGRFDRVEASQRTMQTEITEVRSLLKTLKVMQGGTGSALRSSSRR